MIKPLQNTQTACFHCGDLCLAEAIAFQDKVFCCEGCKLVFELLEDHNLGKSDNIEKLIQSPNKTILKNQFSFLDDDDVKKKLLSFSDQTNEIIVFSLPQIHCTSCIWLLENLYRLNSNIKNVQVDFLKRTARIIYNKQKTSLRAIAELLTTIGYKPQIQLNDIYKSENQDVVIDKNLIYKIGVAGFCFGNIMLLSFPEYLSLHVEPEFQLFFRYINLILSLPIIFYVSIDYFRSAFIAVKNKNINIDIPLSLGIISFFLRSVFEIVSNTGAGYFDSLAGLLFFLSLGKYFQRKTYNRISFDRDYNSFIPIAISKIENGKEMTVAANKVRKGDRLIIRNNEIIPTDAILLKGNATIDYSFISGESLPIQIHSGDLIYAGGKQTGSIIEVVADKDLTTSTLTQLWNNSIFDKKNANEKQFSSITDKASKRFTIGIIAIAFFSLFYWMYVNPANAVNAFTSVLIIACPCALAISAPFALGNAIKILAQHGLYVKNTSVLEKLSQIDTIVFDKTGTITKSNESNIQYVGNVLLDDEINALKSLFKQSSHPLSIQLYNFINGNGNAKLKSYSELIGSGISACINNKNIKAGSLKFINSLNIPPQVFSAEHKAGSKIYVSINDKIQGCFVIQNKYRENLKKTTSYLSNNYALYLFTGDNASEERNLAQYFANEKNIQFQQKPIDKLNNIKKLQNDGKKVAMIGDGLNDAGALKQSNVGISISESVNTFSPACDAILDANKFDQLPSFFVFSAKSVQLVKISFFISLTYNCIGLWFATHALLSPVFAAVLMPLSSISIVLFGIIGTTILAKKYLVSDMHHLQN